MDENTTVHDRPFTDSPCGCRHFPPFTEGQWTDNFGGGPRIWQAGTHFEPWTDTSECREGHHE